MTPMMRATRLSSLAGLVIAGTVAVHAATPVASGTATVAGRQYPFSGPAECTYTADGSIYDVPAAIFHASLEVRGGGLSSVNATIFHAKAGAPQATLTLVVSGSTVEIATVARGTVKGAATARGERKGAGGTLTIDGRTASGQPVTLSLSCSAFTAPDDNG